MKFSLSFTIVFLLAATASAQLGRPIRAFDYAPVANIFFRRLQQPMQFRAITLYATSWYNSLVIHSEDGLLYNGSEPLFRRPNLPDESHGFVVSAVAVATTLHVFGEEDANEVSRIARDELFLDLPLRAEDVSDDNPVREDLLLGFSLASDTIAAFINDGMNEEGTDDGSTKNLIPFEDTTGYAPINSPDEIRDLRRWTPLIESPRPQSIGEYSVQRALAPQAAFVEPLFLTREVLRPITVPAPYRSEIRSDATCESSKRDSQSSLVRRLCADTDEVIEEMSSLTEEQKVMIEYYDDPVLSLSLLLAPLAANFNVSYRGGFLLLLAINEGMYETTLMTFREKRRHDAVRPQTLIQNLYRDVDIESCDAPKQGQDFASFIRTPARQEYPSLHAAQCQFFADMAGMLLGTNNVNVDRLVTQGSSNILPGELPSEDFTVRIRDMQRDIADVCSESRIWSGTSLRPAVERGREIGSIMAREYVNRVSCVAPENDVLPPCAM